MKYALSHCNNPLEDLEHLRQVKMVFMDGQFIDKPIVKRIKKLDNALDQIGK